MQNRESRNLTASLDLPAHRVQIVATQAAQMQHLTFAQLVALAVKIQASLESASVARKLDAGRFETSLDQIDAQLTCDWAMVEAEMERRLTGKPT